MPRHTGPKYGGDYNDITAAKLADVGLPEHMLCKNCGMDKPISQYSKRQKSNLRFIIFRYKKNGPSALDGAILCRACTPQVTNELLCIMCDHVKDLSSFAKNHRNKPEQARCKECMYEQMINDEPGLEEYSAESDSERSNAYESDDDTQTEGGDTLPLTLGNLYIKAGDGLAMTSDTSDDRRRILSSRLPFSSTSQSEEDSTIDNQSFMNGANTEDDLRSNASTIGGVAIGSESAALGSQASVSEASIVGDDHRAKAMSAASRWERMKTLGYRAGSVAESEEYTGSGKGKGKAFTGYDPQGNPHRRFRAASIVSDSGSISNTARSNFPRVRPEAFATSKSMGTRNLKPSRDDFPKTSGHHVGYDDDDDDDEGEMYL